MMERELPYDPTNKESIVEYAQVLVGSTLRDHVDIDVIDDPKRRKGSFGNAVEEYYFLYDLNSDSEPDFKEAGLELKTTPLKKDKKGQFSAKERLVLSMINYMDVVNETFETSSVLHKTENILLISYLYEKDKDPLDYEIEVVSEWGIPEEDMPIIKKDWETVVGKIRDGKAHEISGSDTLYLEACTKAANSSVRRAQPFSDVPAKPRAWALKGSYMTAVQNGLIDKMQSVNRSLGEESLSLLNLVRKRFKPFFGMTQDELAERFGIGTKGAKPPKNLTALATRRILGVEDDAKIAEFEKAGIKTKTIRLNTKGRPKEAVSFPKFDYYELADTDFEESDFYGYLLQKYLFVIYRENRVGNFLLSDVTFWQMPDQDLEEAKRCYDEMRRRVLAGKAAESVKSTENRCCHVRPHGADSSDTIPVPPDGRQVVKKCFWLNQGYLAEEIERALKGDDGGR